MVQRLAIAPMTRAKLIERLAVRLPFRETERHIIVCHLLEIMSAALAQGRRIEVRDFGVFHLAERKGRRAHNPRTGVWVLVPAKRVVRFRPGKRLSERVAAKP